MKRIFALATFVAGVGPVKATELIITTEAFTKLAQVKQRKYARYSGVIPLLTLVGLRSRKALTTKRANRHLKRLLTMGALTLIKVPGDLRDYYQRKTLEDKQHLTVINAMRNKIILRVFAAVRNDTMYSKEYQYMQ